MSALLVFLAVVAVLAPIFRLRDRFRPEPYDAPGWWWRLKLAWHAYRARHGRGLRRSLGRARRADCPPRRMRTVRRHPGLRTGDRVPVPDLTPAERAAASERW